MAVSDHPGTYLQTFGVAVVIGATTTLGVEDYADEGMLGDDGRAEVTGRVRTVWLRTSDVVSTSLTVGSSLTVAGVARVARWVEAREDGVFTLVGLR